MFANPVFITPGRHRFWESKWISAISLVCTAVLNESETPLKRNPVLSIYTSSNNAILLLFSSWFPSVAGPSLACGHPPITLLQKNGKWRRRWRPDGGGRRKRGSRKKRSRRSRMGRGGGRGEGRESNRNLVGLPL